MRASHINLCMHVHTYLCKYKRYTYANESLQNLSYANKITFQLAKSANKAKTGK